jgi:enterochelin esterase-like enzyme
MSEPTTTTSTAAGRLPQLTKQESYLAALEDDELLPIIANKRPNRTERERLGLAQDSLAGTAGGSLALHDELGEQLAGVSTAFVLDSSVGSKK